MSITALARWAVVVLMIASSTIAAHGQSQSVTIGSGPLYGYLRLPEVAPGSIVTLFTPALGVPDAVATQIPLPTSLSGISVLARVIGATNTTGYPGSLPVLRVYTANALQMPDGVACPTTPNSLYCSNTQITVEIPTEGVCAPSPLQGAPLKTCATPPYNDLPPLLVLNVSTDGVTGPDVPLQVVSSAPRLLNSCDSIFGPQLGGTCHPMVTHSDGTLVSNATPARVGETVTVYAVGYGSNSAPTGYAPTVPSGLGGIEALTFEYPYSLAAAPTPPGIFQPSATAGISVQANWIGAFPGYVGLYQVNVTVPPAPGQSYQACGLNGNADITFSLNSGTLYICVQP